MIRKFPLLLLPLMFAITCAWGFCPVGGFWVPSAEVDGKIGSFRKGAGITLFAPVCQDDNSLVFWQTNFGNYRKVWTGSLGLGYRRLFSSCVAWGVNGFADVSYSEASQTYGQLGFGGELLGRCWEARVNGYVPTTRRTLVHEEIMAADPFVQQETRRFFATLGNYRLFERSYKGFDAEAGYAIKLWRGQLWGYGGYYWFDDRGARPIEGPRVRLEYHLFNLFRTCGTRVVLAGEWGYDHLHRHQGLFLASLRIPLCGFKKGCALDIKACQTPTLCQRMNNRVIREPGIWIDRTREDEHYDAPILGRLTGGARHLYFVTEEGGGNGSLENPLSLNEAFSRAGPEDFLFLMGDFNVRETLALQYGQTLMGSGSRAASPLDFVQYGIYSIESQGEDLPRALLRGDGVSSVIAMGHHSVVRDVDIDVNGGPSAIVASGTQNLRISRGTVSNASGDGISLVDVLNPTVYDVDLHNIGGNALSLSGTGAVIRKLDVDGAGGNALAITASDGILVEGLYATDLGGHAVLGESSKQVILRSIGGNSPHTVSLSGVTDYAIHDSQLHASEKTTLSLQNCHGRGFFQGNELRGTGNIALSIGDNWSEMVFAGENTLKSSGGHSLQIFGSEGRIDARALAVTFEGESVGVPFQIQDAKEAHFGSVELNLKEPALACATITGSDVSFEAFRALNVGGSGLIADNGTLSIDRGAIATRGGPALNLTGVKGSLAFVDLKSGDSPTHCLTLHDFDGLLHVGSATLVNAHEGAILFDGGAGVLNLYGAIANSSGHLLHVRNLDPEGAVSLIGLQTDKGYSIQARGGQGILLENCAGSCSIAGVDLECHNGQAYLALNSIGRLTLLTSKLASSGATPEVVGVYNGANFLMKGCQLRALEGGLQSAVAIMVGSDLPTVTIHRDGEADLVAPPTPQQITVRNTTFKGTEHLSGSVVDARVMGSPGVTQLFVCENDTGNAPNAYSFLAGGPQGELDLVFWYNKGEREAREPIRVAMRQEGDATFHLADQEKLVESTEELYGNWELVGGHVEPTGKLEGLWPVPDVPKVDVQLSHQILGAGLRRPEESLPAEKSSS